MMKRPRGPPDLRRLSGDDASYKINLTPIRKGVQEVLRKFGYALVAGLSDFHFLAALLTALIYLSAVYFPDQAFFNLAFSLILALSLTATLVYHGWLSKRVLWLTPGEHLAGRIIEQQMKQWENPYDYQRGSLFLVVLLTLVLSVHVGWWGGDPDDYWGSITLSQVVARMILSAALYYGLVRIGQGHMKDVRYPLTVLGILLLLSVIYPNPNGLALIFPGADRETRQITLILSIPGVFLYSLIAVVHYLRDHKRI